MVEAFPSLPSFALPLKILVEPVPNARWFVLEKDGLVRVFDPAVATSISTYIDLTGAVRTDNEGGLALRQFHLNQVRNYIPVTCH